MTDFSELRKVISSGNTYEQTTSQEQTVFDWINKQPMNPSFISEMLTELENVGSEFYGTMIYPFIHTCFVRETSIQEIMVHLDRAIDNCQRLPDQEIFTIKTNMGKAIAGNILGSLALLVRDLTSSRDVTSNLTMTSDERKHICTTVRSWKTNYPQYATQVDMWLGDICDDDDFPPPLPEVSPDRGPGEGLRVSES